MPIHSHRHAHTLNIFAIMWIARKCLLVDIWGNKEISNGALITVGWTGGPITPLDILITNFQDLEMAIESK